MKRITLSAAIYTIILLYSWRISAQQEMFIIDNTKYYTEKNRAPVSFPHLKHMSIINDCMSCHHRYDSRGKNILAPEELAEGEQGLRCPSCHAGKVKQKYKLYQYYHLQCIGCHDRNDSVKKGPRLCADCHPGKGDR